MVESKSSYGIFINLAPGITGLLPNSVIKEAKDQAKFSRLQPGDEINVIIQKVDSQAKRISLNNEKNEPAAEDQTWRKHTKTEAPEQVFASGLMAAALSKAFNKKNKGE